MSEDKIYKEIHKLITKDITLPFEYPLPCSQPARLTPIPDDQHRDFEMFTEKRTVHTPIIELVCHDLLKAALSEEQVVVQKKEKKKEMIDIQVDKEICYEEIVRDSFQFVDSEIVHPFAPNVEVEEVYDLFPDTKNLENKYDIISVVDNENMGDFEATGDEKIPSGIFMNGNEYGCTAMDISDYVYVSIVDGKAVYNEIGANIKLHRKNN